MCFSAPASFAASGVLAIIGTVVLSRLKSKRHLLIALVPFFFAIQQLAEGFVWVSMPNANFTKSIFLFFAYSFWPTYIPFAVWVAERTSWRKQFLSFLIGMGLVVSIYLLLKIPATQPICYNASIHYLRSSQMTAFGAIGVLIYFLCTTLPFFISSIKKMWILGLVIAIAGILTLLLDRVYFVSMWCFYSALLSIILIFIIPQDET